MQGHRTREHSHHQRHLKLFPVTTPLQFVTMDILIRLPNTTNGNPFVIVMTKSYSKLTRAVPQSKMTPSHAVLALINNRVVQYGMPSFLLTDNVPQFVSKSFNALCGFFGVQNLTTKTYHSQTKVLTELYSKTIVARLHQYVNKHQSSWVCSFSRSHICTADKIH